MAIVLCMYIDALALDLPLNCRSVLVWDIRPPVERHKSQANQTRSKPEETSYAHLDLTWMPFIRVSEIKCSYCKMVRNTLRLLLLWLLILFLILSSLLRVTAHRLGNFLLMVAMHDYYYCILTGASSLQHKDKVQ